MLASTLLAPLGVPLISPALSVVRDAFGITDAQASLNRVGHERPDDGSHADGTFGA